MIIYQEQVAQIAQVLSGFTAGEADILRRAMGKESRIRKANKDLLKAHLKMELVKILLLEYF